MNLVSRKMGGLAAALCVLVALPAMAEPANGVPFEPRSGFYVETQIGVFTAMGGRKTFSNAQPYLGVSFGADLPVLNLQVFGTVAHGFNAGSCRVADERGCERFKLSDGSDAAAPDDFSVIPLEFGVRYAFIDIVPRLKATATVVAGFQFLTPQVYDGAPIGTLHAGGGVGVAYATRLPGLELGAEVLARVGFSPMLPSLSIYPRIRYVF